MATIERSDTGSKSQKSVHGEFNITTKGKLPLSTVDLARLAALALDEAAASYYDGDDWTGYWSYFKKTLASELNRLEQ